VAAPDGVLDARLHARYGLVAGVDEVGRGAIAGPLAVAAVILDPAAPIAGVNDSKRLSPGVRRRLAAEIRRRAVSWTIVYRSAEEVDRLNVLEATRSAMAEAIARLRPQPAFVVSDAVSLALLATPTCAEVRADARYQCVAAASIVAKVSRDACMAALALSHPGYDWERNNGYGTRRHLEALRRLGPSPLHRLSFGPVRVLG
jgi:ribonuclease HII